MSYSPIQANDIESLRSLVQFDADFHYLDIQALQQLQKARQQWPLLAELYAAVAPYEHAPAEAAFSTSMATEVQQ